MIPTVVPILGISQRSGTHWLADLLAVHPACRLATTRPGRAGAGWEDLLLEQSPLLLGYARRVRARWGEGFDDPELEDALVEHLGRALLDLVATLDPHAAPDCTHVVTKSPTVAGLDGLPRLWPATRPIVLVRDARAVVASATRSFGGSPERWARVWREGARTILAAIARDDAGQLLIVRYEDLLEDLAPQVDRICRHVGLDPSSFDHAAAGRLGVRGSSQLADRPEALHWSPQAVGDEFDPLVRRDDLAPAVRTRVEWLAAAELDALGYDVTQPAPDLRQRARDLAWAVGRLGRRAIGAARRRRS